MPPSRPQTPADVQVKEPQQGVPRYGCRMASLRLQPCTDGANKSLTAHLQQFLGPGPQTRLKETISHYKDCLGVVLDGNPIVRQTSKAKEQPLVTLRPNYLCLQCSATTTEQNRLAHGEQTKHRFCMAFARFLRIETDRCRRRIESWICLLPDV